MIPVLTIFFCSMYAVFLFWCLVYWNKLKTAVDFTAQLTPEVAVIVPVRNEEFNVEALLKVLSIQNYSHYEVILADDHSTDDTLVIAEKWIASNPNFNARCIRSNGQSKKDAIAHAINLTQAELIITTDADCRMNEKWISTLVKFHEYSSSYLISAPVIMKSDHTIIGKIQSAEYAGLIAIGAAAIAAGRPMYCSGANLLFERKKFIEVNGYSGSKSSSGDDTQLMRKIHTKWPGKISFLKDIDASVTTTISANRSDLFEQRRRWASKIPATLSAFTITIAALAWLVHAILLLLLFWTLAGHSFKFLLLSWLIKIFAEIIFLIPVMKFMKQKLPFILIVLIQPLYAVYIVMVGVIAPFTSFRWKDRVSR